MEKETNLPKEVFSSTAKDPFVCRPKKGISRIRSYDMGTELLDHQSYSMGMKGS